jgi:hypothetical protein
VISEVVMVVR